MSKLHQKRGLALSAVCVLALGATAQADEEGSAEPLVWAGETVPVTEIPAGRDQIEIELSAWWNADLDLQLATDEEVLVARDDGLLDSEGPAALEHEGMEIEYSGYGGDGSSPGNETLSIQGATPESLEVAVYGAETGFGAVSWSWQEAGDQDPILEPEYVVLDEIPDGELAYTVQVHENRAYVGTESGLLARDLDEHGEWETIHEFEEPVYSIAFHPENPDLILVGLGYKVGPVDVKPIQRSTDGGESFTPVGEIFDHHHQYGYISTAELTYEPETGRFLVSAAGGSIASSLDEGQTWQWEKGNADSFGYYCMLGTLPAQPG